MSVDQSREVDELVELLAELDTPEAVAEREAELLRICDRRERAIRKLLAAEREAIS